MSKLFRRAMPALLGMLLVLWSLPAVAQIVNFKPLERGEYTEEEEQLHIMRGIAVSGDYAIRSAREKHNTLDNATQEVTIYKQDIRLNMRTVFHRDVEMHLVVETQPAEFDSGDFRADKEQDKNRIDETQSLALSAREAYLRYKFNPGSGLILGKQEISLGDRRGKTFEGIAPGITYDCKVGTWCMPFGALHIGSAASDWIFHWALEYTAWESENNSMKDTLQVEIFRMIYTENNVPLGRNRGPGRFNRTDPDNPKSVSNFQEVDSIGNPIYYDAGKLDYFGLRMNWASGPFFFNFDITSAQGDRKLHRYRNGPPIISLDFDGTQDVAFSYSISGIAWESEFGLRQPLVTYGLRMMVATGDPALEPGSDAGLTRGMKGYYEITPGSYKGNRLYFNGSDATVVDGAGLGHSINNTRMFGLFIDYADPVGRQLNYSFGLYRLERLHLVYDQQGLLRRRIGTEMDNRIGFYLHKAIQLQFEVNVMWTGFAFAPDDATQPTGLPDDLFLQAVVRLVYSF